MRCSGGADLHTTVGAGAGADVQMCRCADVQMCRCCADVRVHKQCRCAKVHRRRGAEVQRHRGAEVQRHRVGGARASEVVQVVQMRWYRDAGVGGAEIQVQTACSILGAGADLGLQMCRCAEVQMC
jgi:hypothetical protein